MAGKKAFELDKILKLKEYALGIRNEPSGIIARKALDDAGFTDLKRIRAGIAIFDHIWPKLGESIKRHSKCCKTAVKCLYDADLSEEMLAVVAIYKTELHYRYFQQTGKFFYGQQNKTYDEEYIR